MYQYEQLTKFQQIHWNHIYKENLKEKKFFLHIFPALFSLLSLIFSLTISFLIPLFLQFWHVSIVFSRLLSTLRAIDLSLTFSGAVEAFSRFTNRSTCRIAIKTYSRSTELPMKSRLLLRNDQKGMGGEAIRRHWTTSTPSKFLVIIADEEGGALAVDGGGSSDWRVHEHTPTHTSLKILS